jgi:hypothetical protein
MTEAWGCRNGGAGHAPPIALPSDLDLNAVVPILIRAPVLILRGSLMVAGFVLLAGGTAIVANRRVFPGVLRVALRGVFLMVSTLLMANRITATRGNNDLRHARRRRHERSEGHC